MTSASADLTPFLVATAIAFGAAWGSFVGVLVDRIPDGRSIGGRSHCDVCGRTLGFADLVPVFSWCFSRGRCRTCGASITSLWTLLEIACAVLAVLAVFAFEPWTAGLVATSSSVLLGLTIIDLRHRRLPNAIVYPTTLAIAVFILVAALAGGALSPADAVIGAAGFGGALLLVEIASRGGMGMGDVKLAALIGLLVGAIDLASVAVAAGAAILLGGVAAIVALARGSDRRSALPFGPMLAVGAVVAIFLGRPIAQAYVGFLR